MKYPIIFKRKRVKALVLSSLMLAFAAAMLVWGLLDQRDITLYVVAMVVFAGSIGFNIFLASEKTIVIDEERLYTCSVFLPKFTVERKDIKGAKVSEEDGGKLTIYYDIPEFNLKNNLSDFMSEGSPIEAPWTFTLSKTDVDKPLSEVKFIIEDIVITEKAKLNSRDDVYFE